jgi:hypothetical protein
MLLTEQFWSVTAIINKAQSPAAKGRAGVLMFKKNDGTGSYGI